MHYTSHRMQFMDREPIYHDHIPPPSSGHGFYEKEEKMTLRWNSRVGTIYIDGAHLKHEITMGDRITLSTGGPELKLFTSPWFRRNHAHAWPSRLTGADLDFALHGEAAHDAEGEDTS